MSRAIRTTVRAIFCAICRTGLPLARGMLPGWNAIASDQPGGAEREEAFPGPDDHVVVFCTSKKLVTKVEKLFQVGWGFF